MSADTLRRCFFKPYRQGPVFALKMWDTGRTDEYGKTCIGYRLTMSAPERYRVLFEGENFYAPAGCVIDSDEMVRSLMSFLTLRPGDTDPEYFAGYTPEQLAYCDEHAEALAMEVMARFGEES